MKYLGIEEELLKSKGGYHASVEIERQPELWCEVVQDIKERVDQIQGFFNRFNLENTKVYLVGAGSSGLAASIVENTLRKKFKLDVEVVNSTKLILQPEVYFDCSKTILMVSFGSSGSTPESVEAVRLAQEMCKDLYQMFILCAKDGLLVKGYQNDKTLYIPLPENTKGKSFAATAEFTCLIIQALAIFDYVNIEDYIRFADYARSEARDIFENKVEMIKEIAALDTKALVTVGSIEYEMLASETALKAVEMTSGKYMSNYNSSIEYRHGPKLIMNSNILCMHYIYPDELISKFDIDMLNEVETDRLSGTVVGVGFLNRETAGVQAKYYLEIKENQVVTKYPVLGVLLYALVMQTLLVHISLKMGIRVDWPSTDEQVPKVANRVVIHRKEEGNGSN